MAGVRDARQKSGAKTGAHVTEMGAPARTGDSPDVRFVLPTELEQFLPGGGGGRRENY